MASPAIQYVLLRYLPLQKQGEFVALMIDSNRLNKYLKANVRINFNNKKFYGAFDTYDIAMSVGSEIKRKEAANSQEEDK